MEKRVMRRTNDLSVPQGNINDMHATLLIFVSQGLTNELTFLIPFARSNTPPQILTFQDTTIHPFS